MRCHMRGCSCVCIPQRVSRGIQRGGEGSTCRGGRDRGRVSLGLELTHKTLLEETLVFSVPNLLAEVTGGTRFGVRLGLGCLLQRGRGGGGDVGNKDRGGRLPGGLYVPEALDHILLAELVHDSKSVEVMRKGVDDGHAGKIIIQTVLPPIPTL